VAHLLGICHSCGHAVEPTDPACARCGAAFRVPADRQTLGLGEIRYVPGRPGDPAPASQVVPAAEVDNSPAQTPASVDADPLFEARVGRMARQLAVSRRWTVAWCAAFVLLGLAVATAFTIPALDLDAGPVGRWLERRAQSAGEVREPDLESTPLEIAPGTGEDAAIERGDAREDTPATSAGSPLDASPEDAPAGDGGDNPEQSRGRSSREGAAADDSMLIYERLARLR
jgi:hypothetical protein